MTAAIAPRPTIAIALYDGPLCSFDARSLTFVPRAHQNTHGLDFAEIAKYPQHTLVGDRKKVEREVWGIPSFCDRESHLEGATQALFSKYTLTLAL